MEKCLVTKLKGVTDNAELLKIGEMRIKVGKAPSHPNDAQGIKVGFNTPTELEIVGDGYFTNKEMSLNNGKKITVNPQYDGQLVYVSQACTVSISNKYALNLLYSWEKGTDPYNEDVVFDIADIAFSNMLEYLSVWKTNVYGDIAAVKKLKNLKFVDFRNSLVYGDIANLKDLVGLNSVSFNGERITGDISNLKNCLNLSSLYVSNSSVTGDIASLKNIKNLTYLGVVNCSLSGDITALNLSKIKDRKLSVYGSDGFSGDLGKIDDNILYVVGSNGKSKFTWTRGSTRTKILACMDIFCDKIDDMLIDMSEMEAEFVNSNVIYKNIKLKGTRTAASDAAVETLQQKGYTVSITPA